VTSEDDEVEAVRDIGLTVSGDLMVPAPPEGEHLWVVPVWYRADPQTITDGDDGVQGLFVNFTREGMVMAGTLGCIICRHSYDAAKDIPCPGRDLDQ